MTVGVARAAAPFLLGFDVLAPPTEGMLQAATARGMRFCGAYLDTLTAATRDRIFHYGFGILPYTAALVHEPLSILTGRARGVWANERAAALEMPTSVHVGIDLELPAAGSDCGGHVDAMAVTLQAAQRGAALYVGVPQPLTGRQLFALLPDRYIKGAGRVVDAADNLAEPGCGWAALQLEPVEGLLLAGVKVDVEVTKIDYEGRALVLWWPN
jgi:hypothetical protein